MFWRAWTPGVALGALAVETAAEGEQHELEAGLGGLVDGELHVGRRRRARVQDQRVLGAPGRQRAHGAAQGEAVALALGRVEQQLEGAVRDEALPRLQPLGRTEGRARDEQAWSLQPSQSGGVVRAGGRPRQPTRARASAGPWSRPANQADTGLER